MDIYVSLCNEIALKAKARLYQMIRKVVVIAHGENMNNFLTKGQIFTSYKSACWNHLYDKSTMRWSSNAKS